MPFTATSEAFSSKRSVGETSCYVDFALQASLAPGNIAHVPALAELGAASFEIFLADLPAEHVAHNAGDLIACLEAVGSAGAVAGVTPGDGSLHLRFQKIADQKYGSDRRAHPASRPCIAETLGVAAASLAAAFTGTRVHIRQISCAASVDILHMRDSDFVTSEVTPHNLLLDEADFVRLGPVAKVMPPLRPRTDVDAVQKALSEGTIDIVATDHAPHTPDEKAAGQGDIHKAPGGIAGAQTFLPVMMRLVDDGLLDFARLVEVCAAAPARMFSLFPRKGALDVGSDADFVVVDPKRPMVIRNDNQLSKAAATPFDGLAVSATPVSTYLRGIPIVQDGKVVGRPLGRFLAPVR